MPTISSDLSDTSDMSDLSNARSAPLQFLPFLTKKRLYRFKNGKKVDFFQKIA